jgi:N-acetylmuramoyl-L-alanine amidase
LAQLDLIRDPLFYFFKEETKMKSKLVAIFAILIMGGLASVAFAYPKICIDPGHGGSDPGAVSYCTEKIHNLECGKNFRDWLNLDTSDGGGGYAWSVIMTRSTDIYVSLSGRCTIANNAGANRFTSIHANAGGGYGSETFCYGSADSTTFAMRNLMQNELIAHGGRYNRGNKTANFYVLIYTNMPATLSENAFVDNSGDAACLNSSSWRNEVAKGFLHAMQRHYGYAAYTPGATHYTYIVDNSNGGFSASSNWWTGSSASDKYGADYRCRSTEAVSDQATWSVNIGSAGTYTVYAWWSAGTNRTANTAYNVYYSGGSTAVYVNQQANGGKWNTLTSKSMATGTNNVKLSCWATTGYVAIADAIKWYK